VQLSIHFHIELRLRMPGAVSLLSHTSLYHDAKLIIGQLYLLVAEVTCKAIVTARNSLLISHSIYDLS
jgi:hypothetical protein